MHSSLIAWIMRAIPFGTIIMYGALGETVTEKSGNLNLGVPGIMYLGGFAGFASAWAYENSAANPNGFVSILIALSCAILASMAGGLIYAFLTISLRANQNVTGLALTTFGMGVANFFGVFILNGASYSAAPIANKAFSAKIPVLSGLGDIGQVVFSYGFLVYAAILLAVVLAKVMHKNDEPQQKIDTADDFVRAVTPVLQSETDLLAEQLRAMQGESARTTTATLRDFSAVLAENQRQNAAASTARLESIARAGAARQKAANDALLAQLTMMETRLKNLEDSNATRMDSVRGALVQGLNMIRADNNKKLDEIRGTVEEKLQDTLQQRINDSFKTVSAQLEQVYKGLGEMQNLAADVGSLKQVLSGVKTRGILGEVQLGAILEQILAPGQYACNVATVPGSTNRVEYAIKMPGQNGTVWLPIDAKFPGDTYAHLQAAQERGDAAAVAAMRKALNNVLRAEARDIHDKYIEVPYTTSFGILFLPFEGLYAEVVSSGVTELLQRDYQITVAGPSTMAALLNALQMGFRTLAIQKRSGEVWTILGAVKTEFEKFGAGLQQMQRHLNQTGSDLEELIGPRSRAITRKLESVQQLDPDTATELLGIEE